jgi:hypothetical protein
VMSNYAHLCLIDHLVQIEGGRCGLARRARTDPTKVPFVICRPWQFSFLIRHPEWPIGYMPYTNNASSRNQGGNRPHNDLLLTGNVD